MPFFSVIVPCCDVEAFLPETLASLDAQSFRDFEIILVVEDSRDRTLGLCRKAQAENPRIKVFTQPRSGSPAAPRNTGLAHAEGRYTVFLDGDDLLEHDALQILAAAIQDAGSPDAVQIACQEFLTGPDGTRTMRKRFFNYLPEDHGKIFSGPEATCRVAALHAYPFPISQISICRKEFLSGHHLSQCPGLLHEDEEWTPRILFLAKSVLALDRALYLYRIRPDSIMGCYTALPDPTPYGTVLRLLLKFAMSQKNVPENVWFAWQKVWLSTFFSAVFFPKNGRQLPAALRHSAVHALLADDGAANLRGFLVRTTLPKRIAVRLILLCRLCRRSFMLLPASWYFRFIYYPLAMRRKKK